MATENNKKIVEKTKEILKNLGYDIKTNHIYEMYARLAGYKTWHVAKTKGIDFSEQINQNGQKSVMNESRLDDILNLIDQSRVKNPIEPKILKLAKQLKEYNLSSYEKMIKNKDFKNVFNYGIDLRDKKFILKNPLHDPGALFCGGMGSGKSVAMRFSLVTHILANSENTIYILFDPIKGMADYKSLFKLSNVSYAVNDPSKIVPIINWIHFEISERMKEFLKVGVKHIEEYNTLMKKLGKKEISSIVLAMEEFHSIPNSEYLKFSEKCDEFGSSAHKFKEILRIGRTFGVSMLAASQRATSDDFPSTMKPGFSQLMAFRSHSLRDVTALNLPQCTEIPNNGYPGLCVNENGLAQFPYLNDEIVEELIAKYYKPLISETLTEKINF